MRIFVTGASGFVGGHVVEGLEADHEVLAMARSDRSQAAVEAFGARAVRCDLGTIEASHLQGVDAVIHCAARVEDYGPREAFWEANVEGTQRMLDASRTAGVRRFVHIGTEAAVFDGHDLVDIDERHPYPRRHRFLYSETKAEAERRVLAASDQTMTALSLRPRLIWGPRDNSVLPALVDTIERGAFAWIDGGRPRTSTVHVANLVHALELALTRGRGARPTSSPTARTPPTASSSGAWWPRPGLGCPSARSPARCCVRWHGWWSGAGACCGPPPARRCRASPWP